MIDSIAAEGFGNEKFGTTFWTDIQTAYTTALSQASSTTGTVSGKVATKNERKDAITTVLVSLLKVLEGNYPNEDEYKGVIRQWGWKKEVIEKGGKLESCTSPYRTAFRNSTVIFLTHPAKSFFISCSHNLKTTQPFDKR